MQSLADPLVTLRRLGVEAPWTAAELAREADRLLRAAGSESSRATTERTLRFYVSRGVVQPPFGRGAGSSWGYPHLVELLAARLAQQHGESLETVAVRRGTMDPELLERHTVARFGVPLPPPVEVEPESPAPAPAGCNWRRIAVEPGMELHLAEGHSLLDHPDRLAQVIAGLRQAAGHSQEEP
ncbi:MAG TPA: hypothetical protein PLL69_09900 [Gemmatimonadales bacterium]|nr:hypothetical protein [Gemmatimonadales bacterium]